MKTILKPGRKAGRKAGNKIKGIYTKRLFISMTEEMHKVLKELSEKYEITQSDVIRQCVRHSLNVKEPSRTIDFPFSDQE